MGVSTDGILFYGFCWDEEKELLPDGEDGRNQSEWQSIILAKRGVPDPWEAYPACDGLEYAEKRRIQNAWVQDNDAAIKARWAAKATINDEFGCDIGRHCSDGCSMPYVYAMESRVVASRGCPEPSSTCNSKGGSSRDFSTSDSVGAKAAWCGIPPDQARASRWCF